MPTDTNKYTAIKVDTGTGTGDTGTSNYTDTRTHNDKAPTKHKDRTRYTDITHWVHFKIKITSGFRIMGAGASIGSYQTAIDQCVSVLKDRDQIKELWSDIDFNGNGYVSLAEIDKVKIV